MISSKYIMCYNFLFGKHRKEAKIKNVFTKEVRENMMVAACTSSYKFEWRQHIL